MKQIFILYIIISFLLRLDIFACSIVSINSGTHIFIGRNFDYDKDGGEICFFKRTSSSYAHFTIHQYGETMPYEGINEFGLFVGQNGLHSAKADTSFTLLKKSTTSLGIIKKILERARNVDNAIGIFKDYNVLFGKFLGFPVLHYLIADKSGNSAVIEYVDGSLNIIRKNKQNYQLLTNFLLSEFPHNEALKQKVFYRYRLAIPFIESAEQYNIGNVRKLLQIISQPKSLMPAIKLIFDEDKKYTFDEIQKIFLIGQAMPTGIMEPFKKNRSYSPEEIGHTRADFLRKKEIVKSYTIWSSIYSIMEDSINIEVYYLRNWQNPKRYNFKEKIKNMKNQTECNELIDLF